MSDTLASLRTDCLAKLAGVASPASLEAWRIEFLGSSGKLKALLGAMKDVPKDQRAAYGAGVNALKAEVEAAFADKKATIEASAAPKDMIDPTEPGLLCSESLGRRHVLMRVREELCDVFSRMGFRVAIGPELEDDEHNFVKLNIPPEHPARDPLDNFYVDVPAPGTKPRMLRSQTSTVQIRTMEAAVQEGGGQLRTPIRIVSPGRVYRPDTVDATHSFMFHQIEGLAIDRDLSMADLKSTLLAFARAYFGPAAELRLRPSFFPFTEPSAELDLRVSLRPDQPPRWMEIGGCGMVDPAVLTACGIDPEAWRGFAFGFGIERLAMGKYGIPDIRLLFENDLRFLGAI